MSSRFVHWISATLLGHVCLFELAFALPLFLLLAALNFSLDLYTVRWALRAALIWAGLGVVAALLVWRAVSLPNLRRRAPER
jgi:hypothetical protein